VTHGSPIGIAVTALLVVAAILPVSAQPKSTDEVRRERMNKINKVWDGQIERLRRIQIEASCKEVAKNQYSAMRFRKRRTFVQACIDKAAAPASIQSIHQVN
jgi:hypothetical protein